MRSRFINRLAFSVLVMLGVSAITFLLMFLAGDPAALLASEDATAAEVEAIRKAYGFDRPIVVQYLDWLWHAVQGDLGVSYQSRRPALELILHALPNTLLLIACALALSVSTGVIVGVLAATFRGSRFDRLVITGSVFVQSLPSFWLGIVMILIFSATLRLLPTSGFRGPSYLILPAVTLATFQVGTFARMVRSSMLEVLDSDFVRTARAKGASAGSIVFGHALPNAALPIITVVGLELGGLYGGAVVTETVFGWPGVNTLALSAITSRDMPVIQAFVLVVGILVVITNLVIDMLYTILDPRTRGAR
ncbi:ABC transporter permease [Chelatococcus asaccharovorans]|uniref:Peptide/nickel transport system permease protein n=1 Tax=Chelatococcus asaccharovorans TaxID=28210 RepID=A0A2V3U696_9HYPH|nr:ABC transporter permease [Chelatococcus asaccharovorans]MBS7705674.1 ABC transporter permease [Chelatococcus asaccharovorans]PXW58692.1 peptide/nickel transport system permease protein [Chelatococcus asaccharovorans]CAH1656942.1 putative peptide transport system permease protein BAB2_1050 [Chelatococcus asaccharovorans]CAH1684939.1 putative peptide transport system permease protein BAB2_1050 [Chelatococcus asaccharovorans]